MDQPGHQPASLQTAMDQPGAKAPERSQQPWEYRLRKYLLLLATLVVTVTYAAGFNPPGGNWQEGARDGRLAGDPIIRDTYYHRYLAFFYCNATAFAASLVVIVLILILAVQHDKQGKDKENAIWVASEVKPLRAVMVLDLLSLVGAYGAGTCRDKISTVYSAVLVATVFIYIVVLKLMDRSSSSSGDEMPVEEKEAHKKMKAEERLRKVLMLLATFAASITYVAGLSTPGGFWDSTEGSHRPGDAILKEHHSLRLTVFLLCNTTAFVASLLISTLLIIHGKKLREKTARSVELYACIVVALVGLIGAYAAGSCRETDTTVYVVSLIGAVVAYILLHGFCSSYSKLFTCCCRPAKQSDDSSALGKARSLVLLLATLAATITYTAGLDPPGGVWQDNDNGHMAGDPILLTTNARRYKAFYYCNSVAFVASLVAIVLVQKEILVKHHVLEAAMILDLFGLIGAYAAGSCRDVSTSIYAMALAGAVLVYVVIHVVFFTLDHQKDKQDDDEDRLLEKRRKRLLLFAILAATITYQAGLTPPGGFLLQDNEFGHHAGDPVLLYNYPRRYNAFFYCNSVSFMLSIALIILLVNPNLYRPAIRSNALSVCTAVGLFCLMGAYAAGSTQHLKTSIYIFVLVAVVLFVVAGLLIVFFLRAVALSRPIEREGKEKENKNGNSAAAESCIAIEQDGKEEENKNGNSAAAESCIPIEQEGKEEVNKNGNSEAAESCMPIEQEGKEEVNKNGNSAAAESCIPIEQEDKEPIEHEDKEKRKEEGKKHARRKYLMLLGILVASVAYQAGLEPPGGAWQSSREGYEAGHPVMHDNRRPQYLAFFYSNSISFMASIVVIIMLLPHWLPNKEKESFTEEKKKELEEKKKKWEEWSLKVMNKTILLDLAALLGAYAAGSSRGWKTSVYVIALIVAVLGYFAIHMKLSKCSERHHKAAKGAQSA